MNIELKNQSGFKGKYRIVKTNSNTNEIISISPSIENLIMKADTVGINLLIRRLGNDLTYDPIITSAEIGTGTTPPANGDTDLETPVTIGIIKADTVIGIDNVMISFFIPDVDLPDDTYNEFALRCGTQLFARSIITPAYVKGSNENTTIEYTITGNN